MTAYIPRGPWRAGACLPAFRAKQELSHYICSDDPQEDSDAIGFTSPHAHGEDSAAAVAQLWAAAPDLLAALKAITDHLAGVAGGPLLKAAGVKFQNGVEGIPTIAAARAAIAKAEGGAS